MKNPTSAQEKLMRQIAERVLQIPRVSTEADRNQPNPGVVLVTHRGDVVVSGADKSNLEAISRETGRPAIEWINDYLEEKGQG